MPPDSSSIPQDSVSLDLISQLSQMVARNSSLSDLVGSAIKIIQTVLHAENCSIMLLNSERVALTMCASTVLPEEIWSTIRIPLGQGIAGAVAQTGQPKLVMKSQALEEAEIISEKKRYVTDSFISVPLVAQAKDRDESPTLLGVLNVTDHIDRRQLTCLDLDKLQAIANLIAGAIDSHRTWIHAHESRRHLSDVMDGLPVGMFTLSDVGTLTLCNRAARRYLNLSPTDDLDRPWQEYFPPSVAPHVKRALQDLTLGHASHSTEFDIPDATGECYHSVRMSVIEADELTFLEKSHTLFLIEDLRQMQELADLRRSDQIKSSFISLISHELRTPLAAIKGSVHLLEQVAPPEMRESASNIFGVLQRNTDRLTRVVNNILDVMDLEAGSLSLYNKHVDLHALIRRIVPRFQTDERPIEWNIELNAKRYSVLADERRFGQVLEHLLENALKFTTTPGRVSLVSSNAEGTWILRVSNTGLEIDPLQRERIFSKFYQVDGTLTRQIGGSGIGLYLCREILRIHGGDIRLDPTFTGGACFDITLPDGAETPMSE